MSLPAIEVSGLSKRYVIQHESRHDNLRDTLHHTARKAWRRLRWGTGFDTEEFMALNDVSFSVQPGEVVGIIGHNGAGKSTLLKILSRITEPTSGKITIRGRVASLLEVGTGFHPDLTGRENIFLNGAILGMSRAEIRTKFDEIVAFAEIEKFLDTPVKRYSSGMYVRLAFAVAAHLEPEILIVDEVLAVGDAQFQKKCLGKMKQVSHDNGRTVLFVSHNTAAIAGLCSSAILMEAGRLIHQAATQETLSRYFNNQSSNQGRWTRTDTRPTSTINLSFVELLDPLGNPSGTIKNGNEFTLRIGYVRHAGFAGPVIPSMSVMTSDGTPVFQHHSRLNKQVFPSLRTTGSFDFTINKLPLPAGTYFLNLALISGDQLVDEVDRALEFIVNDGIFYQGGETSPASHGLVLVDGTWRHCPSEAP